MALLSPCVDAKLILGECMFSSLAQVGLQGQ